jgi:zona occludens toxin
MLVFNEGVPRSGKSYDAVKNHILVALKAGRKVYARVNGLNHEKIADYLGMNVEIIRDLLVTVTSAQVVTLFVAQRDPESSEWCISDELKNALFVVDECHEFYVASREAISPAIEQFFALCGQNGMDGVLMSQWYRRLHSSVRARIERKNVFQKLTAVGMSGKYIVSRYHTTTPDRFEKTGSDTCSYDAAIFPLYRGYADGATNVAVYKSGGKTVWHKIAKWAIVVVPAVLLAFVVFHGFFHGTGGLVKPASHPVPSRVVTAPLPAQASEQLAQVKSAASPVSLHPAANTKGMSPEVAYVFNLTAQARPRMVGWLDLGSEHVGIIEWREDQGHVLDRMTTDQLRSLGVTVVHRDYGIKVSYKDQAFIATAWPVDMPGTDAAANRADAAHSPPVASLSRSPVPSGAPSVAAGDRWPVNPLAHAYVPPALAPHELEDNWKPGQ